MKWLTTIVDRDSNIRVYGLYADNFSQFRVLRLILQWQVLGADTQMSHREIADRIGIASSTVSTAIRKLVEHGAITKEHGFFPSKLTNAYKVVGADDYI